jgi:ATP-dependent exoDNAse (exonuclease V) alpha subunit
MTLTTTKALSEIVNNYFMGELPGKETQYQGTLMGSFDKSYMPTAMDLQLKSGAQIMMLNNDMGGRWVNGTIGKIEQVEDKFVKVILAEQEEVIRIDQHRWEIFRTFLNEDGNLETSSIGSFSQLPLMLAWSCTIHKAQGKTFDKIIVNTGRGAFAHGQVYVALSRCRDLDGIVLRQPIQPNHIHVDEEIKEFMRNK